MNEIIFLDCDGVINSEQAFIWNHRLWKAGKVKRNSVGVVCPINMSNLNYIMEETKNVDVVISSVWRIGRTLEEMREYLKERGFLFSDRIIGLTANTSSGRRDEQIIKWLEDNNRMQSSFIVIDDETFDLTGVISNVVKTDMRIGLTIMDANEIIEKIEGK